MEEWVMVKKSFKSEEEAGKFANVIQITESRLTSSRGGPQFEIETEVFNTDNGWQVRWKKVFAGFQGGCGNCNSCSSEEQPKHKEKNREKGGKVIQLRWK